MAEYLKTETTAELKAVAELLADVPEVADLLAEIREELQRRM